MSASQINFGFKIFSTEVLNLEWSQGRVLYGPGMPEEGTGATCVIDRQAAESQIHVL